MQYEEALNPQQLEAVRHVEGPMLVIAGAGSGKTRVVTFRICHLLELGVPSTEIIAVTFTNKAAEEMRSRIQKLANTSILASTFHSLCARILRESIMVLGFGKQFAIFDEEDSEKLLSQCLAEKQLKDEKGLLKQMRLAISSAKNALQKPEAISMEDPLVGEVYALYQAKLKACNALDFDDLLFLTVDLFQTHPDILKSYQDRWSFVLIDEYQDTNEAQYLLVKLLAGDKQNVFAVGDPDQSIYSWRGARIQNILNFSQDYPGAKVQPLEQNYRSKEHILAAANGLISHNSSRYEKNLWSERGEGEKVNLYICESDKEEVAFVISKLLEHHKGGLPLSKCAIFYRTHSQSRLFEDGLLKRQIPYQIIGGVSFYQRREVKDLLAYLRMAVEGRDLIAFSRTINLPKRGIGPTTITKLRALSEEHNLSLLEVAQLAIDRRIGASLSQKQAQGLDQYLTLMRRLRAMIDSAAPISEMLEEIVDQINYYEFLEEDPETAPDRKENVEELISTAMEWENNLIGFLQDLALKSSADKSTQGDCLRLMTLHNGKGLEFSVCFLVGMEEELSPHVNSYDNPAALEEERRLCYVGMTRAEDYLYMSAARFRLLWGNFRPMRPSRFLFELPSQHVKKIGSEPQTDQDTPFISGDFVIHRDFGRGVVQKAYQTSLGTTYDVFFPESGLTRSLVSKFAKLERA